MSEDPKKKPAVNIAEADQAFAHMLNLMVPHWASVFRALCKEEDVSRAEALAMTVAYIQKPLSRGGG